MLLDDDMMGAADLGHCGYAACSFMVCGFGVDGKVRGSLGGRRRGGPIVGALMRGKMNEWSLGVREILLLQLAVSLAGVLGSDLYI